MRQFGARENHGFHLHVQHFAMGDLEAVGARATGAVQQGVKRDGFAARIRCFDPEGSEVRKFLARRLTGLECQPARGQSVILARTDAAEIARTLEYGVFGVETGVQQIGAQAQAGIAHVFVERNVGEFIRCFENVKIKQQRAGRAILDDVHLHRAREVEAGREDIQSLGAVGVFP